MLMIIIKLVQILCFVRTVLVDCVFICRVELLIDKYFLVFVYLMNLGRLDWFDRRLVLSIHFYYNFFLHQWLFSL
jgi:hypothetical protein